MTCFLTRKDASASASEISHCDVIALVQYKLLTNQFALYLPQRSDLAPRCPHHDLKSEVATGCVLPRAFAKCSGADKGIEVIRVGWKKSPESSGGDVLL